MATQNSLIRRNGEVSSKKVWFNIACLVASVVLLWITFFGVMDDYALIIMYSVYLVTVGGFEVIPKMLAMIIEFKTGAKNAPTSD